MEYKVSAFKVIINGVKAFDIYLADWDWLCELLDYTEEPDTTRDQLVEFYNKIRTEIPELGGYPEYN